jgi:glyoxylase-like metal-dependent hydrolase (beta-lactamase superfamily II)
MIEPKPIDCLQLGERHNICCWAFGEVIVDPGPTSCLENVLPHLEVEPRVVLLTHIHLDHAGAAGTLARRYPDLEVYVHERGAPHLIDPTKLLASATRLYGEHMDLLWGAFEPVPEDRLHVLHGGETLPTASGAFEVAYTPGHAVHHVSYLHESGTAFTGDVAGVRPTQDGPVVPPTPPPDIDPPTWRASIQRLRHWQPDRLAFTHWGATDAVSEHLDELEDRLTRWSEAARTLDAEAWSAMAARELAPRLHDDAARALYAGYTAGPNHAGLRRYWDKRAS